MLLLHVMVVDSRWNNLCLYSRSRCFNGRVCGILEVVDGSIYIPISSF